MMLHEVLRPKTNVNKLYMKRKNYSRALICIQNCTMSVRRTFVEYLMNSDEDLLQYASKDMDLNTIEVMSKE